MSDADRSYFYRASCGQITGRSHLQSNTPCQDYAAARTQHEFACIALADGAGSRTHSAHGARAVVRAVTRALLERFEEIWALSELNSTKASEVLLEHCRTALEREAIKLRCEASELASTMLFVAHSKGRYLAGHVGDGCIIHQQDDGQVLVLSHPDNGEYANTTFFMTDSTVHSRFRLYRGECGQGSGFVIMSDGTAESLYQRAQKSPATSALRKIIGWCGTATPKAMRDILAWNLKQSFATKTTDDCSMGVLALTSESIN
ncbi:PP2C family serine/threonine-protein phosphatase [Pseudomonas citri]|uniref:PP2C family serine/threonine-protein phosphatase n=1 Tax=Pseudomonas citri TaxID=2978349 RepID=UPI0021B68ADE|nr:PP2C family serine/threonine-protein phosphatase [Pseudomonas citri]